MGFIQSSFFRVWLPFVAVIPIWFIFVDGPGPRDWVRWIGLLLAVAGLAGVIVARYTLGQSFTVTAQARQLVTRGIYSKIRNPIYVSGAVTFAGFIFMVRIEKLWLVLAPIVVMQVIRARKEARVLEARFGDEYRRYRARTWV